MKLSDVVFCGLANRVKHSQNKYIPENSDCIYYLLDNLRNFFCVANDCSAGYDNDLLITETILDTTQKHQFTCIKHKEIPCIKNAFYRLHNM